MNIIDQYKKYYQHGNNWQDLLNEIINYDFSDFESFNNEEFEINYTLKPETDLKILTNNRNPYFFGPVRVLLDIENYIRYDHLGINVQSAIFVEDSIIHNPMRKKIFFRDHRADTFIVENIHKNAEILIETIHKMAPSKFFITGNPHSLDQIIKHKYLLDSLKSKVCGLVNLNCPAFVNKRICASKKVYFNDQMINWRSGLNFFTCSHGHFHFLPIFKVTPEGIINLLNTSCYYCDPSDYFTVDNKVVLCECGRNKLNFDFISHKNNFFDNLNYLELMKLSNYIYTNHRLIQFVQKNNELSILLDQSLTNSEIKIICNFFKTNKIKLYKNQYNRVGSKYPCFWKFNE
jgi:hypothetical protein